MGIARPFRIIGLLTLAAFVYLLYILFGDAGVSHTVISHVKPASGTNKVAKGPGDYAKKGSEKEPLLDLVGEPEGKLWRAGDGYAPGAAGVNRINATLLSLVRNMELGGILQSMDDLERTWNHKFNYPWTFFNDEPFTEEFKAKTAARTKAACRYELIPKEHWDMPSWIDYKKFEVAGKQLEKEGIQFSSMASYHQMCRWNSGMFYKHPALAETQYYWRVEPNVHFFCDVDYDVFRYMQDNGKTYGFNINLYDGARGIKTLWPETQKFLADHPESVHKNNAMDWLTDAKRRPEHNALANGYSTCHFWSNFEVADLSFFRSPTYTEYFDHLDKAGGFFYERWGDAPVHSIALGLFEDKNKLHWFKDIGYQHVPYFNCPNSPKCRGCKAGLFTDGDEFLYKEDCRPNWFKYVGMG